MLDKATTDAVKVGAPNPRARGNRARRTVKRQDENDGSFKDRNGTH